MRRSIGIVAFVLALAVLASAFFALRQGVGALSAWNVFTHLHRSIGIDIAQGPVHHGRGSRSAQGLDEIVVEVPTAGAVDISTAPTDAVSWQWTATGRTAGIMEATRAGSVLTLAFSPAIPVQLNLGAWQDRLQVTLPENLAAHVAVTTGTARATGAYRSLSATVTTGALDVNAFRGQLSGEVVTGSLTAKAIQAKGALDLQVGTGSLTFAGDPGLNANFAVQTGPLSLGLSPHGRLAVRASAHLGPLSSGFPGLGSGTNGTFSGSIGQGPGGTLTVDDSTGPVSIMPE